MENKNEICVICSKKGESLICSECLDKMIAEADPIDPFDFKYVIPPKNEDKEKELIEFIETSKNNKCHIRIYFIHSFYGPMRSLYIDVLPNIKLVKGILKDPIKDIKSKLYNKSGLSCNLMIHSTVLADDSDSDSSTIIDTIKKAKISLNDVVEKSPDIGENPWYFRRGKLL